MKSTLIQGIHGRLPVLWQRQGFIDNANIQKKRNLLELNNFSKKQKFLSLHPDSVCHPIYLGQVFSNSFSLTSDQIKSHKLT